VKETLEKIVLLTHLLMLLLTGLAVKLAQVKHYASVKSN
jgi:hypothetical protein